MIVKNIFYIFLLVINFFSFSTVTTGIPNCCQLSLKEKIGQLLCVHFYGETSNELSNYLIDKLHVSGFIYYNTSNGLHSPEQVRNLTDQLQKHVQEKMGHKIPLFIAIDQEGGLVQRLHNRFTKIPSVWDIGHRDDPVLESYNYAHIIASELALVGINMNCAPVVDVASEKTFARFKTRMFHDDPFIVAQCALAMLRAYEEKNIISVLKHFPGHGNCDVDSHVQCPVNMRTYDQFYGIDYVPFAACCMRVPIIMTGHIKVPALDEKYCATVSEKILRNLARTSMGFNGVIMSDSLTMDGILGEYGGSIEKAAIAAFNAGCDLLCIGTAQLNDDSTKTQEQQALSLVQRVYRALLTAINSGEVSHERLDDAVQKILLCKKRYLRG